MTGSPSWRQYSMTCSSVRPICSAIAVQLSPASRSIRTRSRSAFCAFPWITFSYGMAVICSSMSGPSSVGAYPAAIGSWPIRFLGRYKFLPTDRAGFQLCRFPVFRFRMFGPPPLSCRRQNRTSWAGQSDFCQLAGHTVGKIDPPHGGGTLTSHYQFSEIMFRFLHLPPPSHSAAKPPSILKNSKYDNKRRNGVSAPEMMIVAANDLILIFYFSCPTLCRNKQKHMGNIA